MAKQKYMQLVPNDWLSVEDADMPFGATGAVFPPENVAARINRCRARWNVEQGIYSDVTTEKYDVPVNYLAAMVERLIDIITASEIVVDGQVDRSLNDTAAYAIAATVRDKTPILWTDPETLETVSLDSRFWYGTTRGWVYVQIMGGVGGAIEGETLTGEPERAFVAILDDNDYSETIRAFNGSVIGEVRETVRTLTGIEDTLVVPGRFGQSAFDLLTPVQLEVNRRFDASSTALDRVSAPDYVALARGDIGVGGIMPTPRPSEPDEITDEPQTSSAVADQLRQIAGDNTIVNLAALGIGALDPVQFDPNIGSSLTMVDYMQDAIDHLAGMPNFFSDDGGFAMAKSGVALRQLNTSLYAKVKRMKELVERGINDSRAVVGLSAIEWPDSFTALETTEPDSAQEKPV